MRKPELVESKVLSEDEVKLLHKGIHDSMYGDRGSFSGINECECGGKVEYGCKRSDGAELGVCISCGRSYIDLKGRRLPSVGESLRDLIIN